MNSIARSLVRTAASESAEARKWVILRLYSSSTTTKQWVRYGKKSSASKSTRSKPPPPPEPDPEPQPLPSLAPSKEWPKPTTIPYQAKAANSLSVIGYVDSPVQFETAADGKFWAGTILTQKGSSGCHPFWMPIIFEGDLAHVAACHLKENDLVCIDGQVTSDPPPVDATPGTANIQVMVSSVNFVEDSFLSKKSVASLEQGGKFNSSASTKSGEDSASIPWRQLLDHPEEWHDYRKHKLSGSVKPKFPDFKRKDGGLALWLVSAPRWVVSELEGVEFDDPIKKPKHRVSIDIGDDPWRDLVENPDKWWDNRLDKKNLKAPDFKHKETGEALWLNSSPAWVQSKLRSPVGGK
ncbi:hypothetical protein SLE2022_270220 [Rubroshorea leprosula]